MQPGAGGLEAELLLHAGWMRQLAAHLVDDAELADDVAQEAALSVLARPPRGVRRPRAYLSEVVRNAARRLGRADQRRTRRELQAARPEALPSSAELAADAELQQALATALLGLEEPYRSTLVLRFYRDLEPTEIARLAGVPPGTVRSRLSRGLELLRARLDERCGGREAWSAALAPLAWTTAGRSGLAATAGLAGGLAMGIKVALACTGAAVVAGALYLGFRGSEEREQEELASAASAAPVEIEAPQAPAGAKGSATALEPAAGATERITFEPTSAAQAKRFVRALAQRPDGEPVAGASIALSQVRRDEPVLATAMTGADGRARLELPPGLGGARLAWSAAGLRGDQRDFEALDDELVLLLDWTTTLTGVVRDKETGEPLDAALVSTREAEALTGPDGRYQIPGQRVGERVPVGASKPGYVSSQASFLVREPGEAQLDLALERGFAFELSFYDRDTGRPLPDVDVQEGSRSIARSDAQGRVSVRAAVGSYLSVEANLDGYCSWSCGWEFEMQPETPAAPVPLLRVAWIEGSVSDERGQPVEDAYVILNCNEHPGTWIPFSEEVLEGLELPGDSSYYKPDMGTKTDDQGHYRMPVLGCSHPSSLRASNSSCCGESWVKLEALPEPGHTMHADLRVTRNGIVKGRVTENGVPLAGVRVGMERAGEDRRSSARTDQEGRYEMSLRPGEYTLALLGIPGGLAVVQLCVVPGETIEQDLTRTVEMGEIRGRVSQRGVPLSGVPVNASLVLAESDGVLRECVAETDAEGAYRLVVPVDGIFTVSVVRKPGAPSRTGVLAGEVHVDFDLPVLGTLRMRLVDTAGEPVQVGPWSGYLLWRPEESDEFSLAQCEPDLDGRQDLAVEPGLLEVLVDLTQDGYAPRLIQGVRVPAEGASDIFTVALERAFEVRLAFESSELSPADLDGHLLFMLEESMLGWVRGPFPEDGGWNNRIDGLRLRFESPTMSSRILNVDGEGAALMPGLAPGRYHLRVFPDDFIFEPEAFDLPSPAGEPLAVRWRRR